MPKLRDIFFVLVLFITSVFAYGPQGHATIGAIADNRLEGKPAAAKISALIDGLSLAEASLLADKIKDWDKAGPTGTEVFHLPAHPKIEAALLAFWEANPPRKNNPKTRPSHHWFHYTDVPITGGEKYADGTIGRQQWDVVNMIPFCIRVLEGTEPEDNPRKITKPVAVILLAHYVGDIHQPLHVGCAFFDASGKLIQPKDEARDAHTQGGNTLTLEMPGVPAPKPGQRGSSLHSYWDGEVVSNAFKQIYDDIEASGTHRGRMTQKAVAEFLARKEPANWKPDAGSKPVDWAQMWANEIMPVAIEAHERLEFSDIVVEKGYNEMLARGKAKPREMPDKVSYADWSGKVTKVEIHKAGWRLAELLERVVK